MGAGDLGAGDGRGAGVRMDLQHRSDLPLSGLDQTVEQVAVGDNSMPHRIPTMLRNLTPSTTVAYRPYTALTRNILSLSSRHSTKCAILIHCATVVLGSRPNQALGIARVLRFKPASLAGATEQPWLTST